jgi:hypothetical protein
MTRKAGGVPLSGKKSRATQAFHLPRKGQAFMRSACWLFALLTGALVTGESQAQFFGFPSVGFGRVSVSAGFGPVRYRVSYAAPLYPGYITPGFGYYSTLPTFTEVHYHPPPSIVLALPPDPPPPREPDRQIPPKWEQELLQREPPRDERPLPGGRPVSVTRPIGFDNRAQAMLPVPKQPPKAAEPRRLPEPKPPALPKAARPEDDPRDEAARLVRLGKQAFAEQEYGRAGQRFRQAIELRPQDALPYFLLARAQLALGKYAEAVASIQTGMRLQPDWPTMEFPPADLYGARIGFFRNHILALQETLAKYPEDWVLLFLLGHEMWFDGRRDEALPLFRRAVATAPDRQAIERFLAAP